MMSHSLQGTDSGLQNAIVLETKESSNRLIRKLNREFNGSSERPYAGAHRDKRHSEALTIIQRNGSGAS
jgi:hypothetical protein